VIAPDVPMERRLAVLPILLLAGCSLVGGEGASPSLATLDEDTAAFEAAFNAHPSAARLLVILAPTCASCRIGARAVRDHVLDADADVEVHVVWGRVLPSDDRQAVLAAAETLEGDAVRHYWDPEMLLGRRLGEHMALLGADFAWDVYLFYAPGAAWGDTPPEPAAWAHQMSGLEADHFRTGDELDAFLEDGVDELSRHPGGGSRDVS